MDTLTKVYQTTANADSGDCFSACIASITGIPVETIPLFRGETWFKECAKWLFEKGFQTTQYTRHRVDRGYHIVTRDALHIKNVGWRCHAVVYRGEHEVHDPISNRSHDEIRAANKAQGITSDQILGRYPGILSTVLIKPLNVTWGVIAAPMS